MDWRKVLMARQAELLAESNADDGAADIVELDQSKVGRLSRMDAMQAQAMAQSADQRRDATLREIDLALQRVQVGDFGICQNCDEPINPKRLKFDPTIVLCIDCASATEAR